jgi:hypothetical protein
MGYVKLFKKNVCYFVINTEKSGPDLGLATGDLGVKTFDLETPYLSLSPPPPFTPLSHLHFKCSL